MNYESKTIETHYQYSLRRFFKVQPLGFLVVSSWIALSSLGTIGWLSALINTVGYLSSIFFILLVSRHSARPFFPPILAWILGICAWSFWILLFKPFMWFIIGLAGN